MAKVSHSFFFFFFSPDQPGHYLFEMEESKRERDGTKRLVNPYFPVHLKGKASLAPGKVGKALRLTGKFLTVQLFVHFTARSTLCSFICFARSRQCRKSTQTHW